MADRIEESPKISTEGNCGPDLTCSLIDEIMANASRQRSLSNSDTSDSHNQPDPDHKINLPHIELDPEDGVVSIGRTGDSEVLEMLNRAGASVVTVMHRIHGAIPSILPTFELNNETLPALTSERPHAIQKPNE